ncbi:unnamed protein product, partial [Prorocentrum cordatum]
MRNRDRFGEGALMFFVCAGPRRAPRSWRSAVPGVRLCCRSSFLQRCLAAAGGHRGAGEGPAAPRPLRSGRRASTARPGLPRVGSSPDILKNISGTPSGRSPAAPAHFHIHTELLRVTEE